MELKLETRVQKNETGVMSGGVANELVGMVTPMVHEDYWSYRVRLSETQAIIGFPKFTTVGIGFANEEDWNTNLPYTTRAEAIFDHIGHNKGDDSITDADCIKAIQLIQDAAKTDREGV